MSEPAKMSDLVAKLDDVRRRQPPRREIPPPDVDPLTDDERVAYMASRRAERWAAVVPSRFSRSTIEMVAELHHAAAVSLRGWLDEEHRPNLVMFGPVGVGKTTAACAAARPLVEAGASAVILSTAKLLDLIRGGMHPGGDPNVANRVIDVDVLVLDDVGAERPTDWTGERLQLIVDERWMAERPIIAATNLDPKALRAAVGDRCYSRLVGGATVVRFTGEDRRARP